MQTTKISQIHKLAAGVVLVILALSLMTSAGIASPNEQTVPTAPPPTTVNTPSRTPTSPGQLTAIATLPGQVTPTQTQIAAASPTSQGSSTSAPIEPSATLIPVGGTIPLVTETVNPIAETLTAVVTPQGPASTLTPVDTAREARNLGSCALVAGVVLLLVAGVVWWLRSRRSENPS